MTDGQFTINDDDNRGVLFWGEGAVDDQGVAIVDAVIVHAIAFDLHEEGSGRVMDKMLIKAEVCGGADDGEHFRMVSRRVGGMQFIPAPSFLPSGLELPPIGTTSVPRAINGLRDACPFAFSLWPSSKQITGAINTMSFARAKFPETIRPRYML